jgi:hypothetical protein
MCLRAAAEQQLFKIVFCGHVPVLNHFQEHAS